MGDIELRDNVESYKLFTLLSIIAILSAFSMLCVSIYYTSNKWFGADSISLTIIPLSVTLLYAISATFLGFFQKKAAIEEEDKKLLEKRKERTSTFETNEDALFTANRTLNNYIKYSPYVIAILALLIISFELFILWKYYLSGMLGVLPTNPLQAAFIAALIGFIALFCGVFSIGQSRKKEFRWLRPTGVWFILSAIMLFVAAVSVLFKNMDPPLIQWDYYLSRTSMVICAILAGELLINFLIEFYRPRTKSEQRPLFESRLLSFFTEPGGVMRNIANTLDYQFGFQVSGTWLYQSIEKTITPLLLMWLGLLWLFTAIDEVAPGEMGVRETFGSHSEQLLPPSVYLKWPWPIQTIRKIPVNQTQEIFIGPELKDAQGKIKAPGIVLWTESHYAKEGRFLIATELREEKREPNKLNKKDLNDDKTPVSMIAALLPIQFKIKEDGALNYAYKHKSPIDTLKDISEREITGYFASADMLKLMSTERKAAIDSIQIQIQKAANKLQLGIEIIAVAFLDAHPPIDDNKLPEEFQKVIGAQEEKEAEILSAKAYRARIIPQAEADALQLILQAQAYKYEQTKVSKAEIERFNKRLIGYRAMPEMYMLNSKLDFLENDCKSIRKYVVPSTSQYDVYVINLEEKQRLDLLDMGDLQE